MESYQMSDEEKSFLENYDITSFERPSLAADIVMFSILEEGERDSIRRLQKKKLKVLLIRRASYPYKDCFALPGGFCVPGEDVLETARRELYEETNVKDAYLKLFGVYGEKERDPRGWIISNAFMALFDGSRCRLKAGTDAWEARWFSIDLEKESEKKSGHGEEVQVESIYRLGLSNEETGTSFVVKVLEEKHYRNFHETIRYEIQEQGRLAFDHAKIILEALFRLKKEVECHPEGIFDLMPEEFTLTQLQMAMEIVQGIRLTTPNFRRKFADFVTETEHMISGEGFRPARLFRRNVERLY